MDPTLRQLDFFIALAEERHFSAAARRMHVSQPALSVQIRELEARLGATLVERGPPVQLTPTGHEVLARARRIRGELEELKSAAGWGESLAGRLRLGVIPTVAPYLLPGALPRLRAQTPGLDLALTEARTETLLCRLEEGQIDAAVLALPAGQAGLAEHPLFTDPFRLAGPRARIEAMQAAGTIPPAHQLDPAELILLEEGHCLADQALELCGAERAATRVALTASSLPTLAGLVAAGYGLTLLPELSLATELAAAPGLAVASFAPPVPGRTIGLVRRDLPGPTGWFDELAALLTLAGTEALAHAPGTHAPARHAPGASQPTPDKATQAR